MALILHSGHVLTLCRTKVYNLNIPQNNLFAALCTDIFSGLTDLGFFWISALYKHYFCVYLQNCTYAFVYSQ